VYKIKTAPGPTKSKTEQEPSVDSSSVSRDDAPKPAEQPTNWYNLRPRSRTQPPSARTARFDVAPSSLPRSAGPSNPLPSLLAQMGSLALSPLHSFERALAGDPRLVNRKPGSGNPPPLIDAASCRNLFSQPVNGGWHTQVVPQIKDRGLGNVSSKEGLPFRSR
jgi:hypothetical protein